MKIFIFLILIILISGLWGYFQVKLFPFEKFGYLYMFTALINGGIIGHIGNKIFYKY